MARDGPKIGPGGFCSTNPDLDDILSRTDVIVETFYFLFLDPNNSNFQVPKSQNSGFPGSQMLQISVVNDWPENSKHKTINNLSQYVCLGNMLGPVLKSSYPNMVGEHWQIQKTYCLCSIFSENALTMYRVLGHLLCP